MFYAVYDFTVKPDNSGYGFCNAKKCAAFTTKKERDAFVSSRSHFDFSCQKIGRKQAIKMAEICPNGFDKGVKVGMGDNAVYTVLKPYKY